MLNYNKYIIRLAMKFIFHKTFKILLFLNIIILYQNYFLDKFVHKYGALIEKFKLF